MPRACSIHARARAPLTPAASATRSGDAAPSFPGVSIPASLSRLAKTGPMPSMTSIPVVPDFASDARNVGGSGSREVATEMNRSRIAHTIAANPPTTPMILASRFTPPRVPKGTGVYPDDG